MQKKRPNEKTIFEYASIRNKSGVRVHRDFEGIAFCIRGLDKANKGERRPHMLYLYVKGNFIVATNGARLHEYRLKEKLPEGFYSVIKKLKTFIIICHEHDVAEKYPAWKKLIPNKSQLNIDRTDLRNVVVIDNNNDETLFQLNKLASHPIRFDYIKALENGMTLKYYEEDKSMFYFNNYDDTMRAIVMGMSP